MQLVSATRFKQANRNRHGVAGLGVRKQMLAPAEALDGQQRTLRFTISTGTVDREKDAISLAGWDLANFKRNPVVLWGHNIERLPIGRCINVAIVDNALKATVQFVPAETPEAGQFAEAVFQLANQGFINATSVGFRPIKWEYSQDPERGAGDWFPGIDFEAQELVELSIVTVPANPEALIEPAQGVPGEVASDTPPTTGEEITEIDAASVTTKEEEARARARRKRVLQLVLATLELDSFADTNA